MRSAGRKHRPGAARWTARLRLIRAILEVMIASSLAASALADDSKKAREPLPEGNRGIAALYPGDVGIERDAKVVFTESFEEDSLSSMFKRWEDIASAEGMSFGDDVPPESRGKRALVLEKPRGSTRSGAGLYRRVKNSQNGWGYDQLFARFYVKFARDCGEIHHFGTTLGGNFPATPWPMVKAGTRPDGGKSFWTGIEPFGRTWTWDYYTYWCEMRGSPPAGKTWGNSFIRDPKLTIERGRWICVELMMKVNQPADLDGEQALWLDGKLVSHLGKGFPNGRWTWDKFEPGKGGSGVRWSEEQASRVDFAVPERWRTL